MQKLCTHIQMYTWECGRLDIMIIPDLGMDVYVFPSLHFITASGNGSFLDHYTAAPHFNFNILYIH